MIVFLRHRLPVAIADWIAPIAAMFLVSRLALLLLANLAQAHLGSDVPDTGWTGLLCRWDCGWYLGIAEHGYSTTYTTDSATTTYAFYPLLPAATNVIASLLHVTLLQAGLMFTNICFLFALFYVYRYAQLVGCDRSTALRSVALICCLPLSISFSAYLTESAFLLLLVMAMFHLRRGEYLLAGIAAALLSASRANGIFFILFALVALFRSYGWRSFVTPWRAPERLLPVMLAPAGMFVFWGFCFATTGDAFAQVTTAHHGWGWNFYPVWENIPSMFRTEGPSPLVALSGICTLACSALLLRMKLYEDFVLCAAFVLLILSGTGTVSVFRYWIVLFPIWIAVTRALSQAPVMASFVYLLIGLLNGVMTCAWALQKNIAL